ncbi:putative flagellar protein FlgN [Pseudomonas savastanoi pv. glycinea]|uniref:Flagellar protein FlgN n=1 Tax=Pseudomonas phytophila TaxID=2867264 RepID=A0ABY6FAI0_9PSED|nr:MULTISPECIES: flagellar protein FlgN [Pseudomonas]RMR01189.1 putative flagellar protein FlgN [Pseudomonas savastanoi pv. glycinea]MCD5975299.1 flagellar protein FlgN [Pseudomonas quasicaspiana]MCD5978633.1 flagellar protein FlgN [Pseudomonas quasicaspiana]MCD5991828.1 flagellar protein FlgN [Pseudomonas quasicaspiana]UXZ94876.1 flagellar protein FlgN [Pseudomonas phytophila]
MQDTTLLQLMTDDMVPAQQLLEILQAESLALIGRDMVEMEHVLAKKQALVVLLEQHGRKRSQILSGLGLSPDRKGLSALAASSSLGEQLIKAGDELSAVITQCQLVNTQNGSSIVMQQASTAHQLRILTGDMPTLYDNRGSTSGRAKPRPLSQA